jgi:hypothetical protein
VEPDAPEQRPTDVRIRSLTPLTIIVLAGATGSITAAQAMATGAWADATAIEKPNPHKYTGKAANLTIVYRAGPGTPARTMRLHCRPPGGDQPRAAEACEALAAAEADGLDPFAAPRPEQICTVGYGGPQTATVKGTWGTRHVRATYARTNGCQIARWNLIEPVLEPTPLG